MTRQIDWRWEGLPRPERIGRNTTTGTVHIIREVAWGAPSLCGIHRSQMSISHYSRFFVSHSVTCKSCRRLFEDGAR